ncbi:HNH endonuclease signature motif containing protein [Streptomyces sp. NPDC006368]|uniref:HNH endonuclease n=1 Tax=Streptomyces sp. NPDC006368 TaxID=3156760 RepID=UPI0033BDD999
MTDQNQPRPLPAPGSQELQGLVPDVETRAVYQVLYESREAPLGMGEIRNRVELLTGKANLQTDRRLRSLRTYFDVPATPVAGKSNGFAYPLLGWKPDADERTARKAIRAADRALTLHAYGYRCAACGRSPKEDGVKLVIDHKVPLDLGGTNDPENLQPLCVEDNHAKQALFADHEENAGALRGAMGLPEVHLRIGELLKALAGQPVPKELIVLVAREENHGDPTRRLRELRSLGWKIAFSKRKDGRRVRSFYSLEHWESWPAGGPQAAVVRLERARKRAQRRRDD